MSVLTQRAQRLDVDRIVELIPPSSSVLDLGCGPGTYAVPLAARGALVTGVDLSATMLDRADLAGELLVLADEDLLPVPVANGFTDVDAIEDGDMILAEALVRSHVDALKRKMPVPDAAILGCTHYPLMQDVFQAALGEEVRVFSQANLVAESLADYLDRHPDMVGTGEAGFLTTGEPARVSDRATQFLRRRIEFSAA